MLVAIDGMCGSGKTTLGQVLSKVYDCNLFHMDDFFLRPEQRTAERMAQDGGNVEMMQAIPKRDSGSHFRVQWPDLQNV